MNPIIRIISTVLLVIVSTINIQSQTVVKGRVFDAKSKTILPYCTVYFEGKKIGSKTDNFGNFTLRSPKTETFLYVSFLGYESKKVQIFGSEFKTDIYLNEKPRKTKKVEIKGKKKLEKDTIAVRIIRNVIKNKSKNKPSAFKSIQFDKYSKFEVDLANIESVLGKNFVTKPLKYMLEYQSETPDGEKYSPLLFRETLSKCYQKGNDKKTIVTGVKDTKLFDNESLFALVSYAFDEYSIYDNTIVIVNKSLLGPAANNALLFYRYYVEDSFEVDGVKNYALSFAPSSKEDFGFTGKILVEEGSWAIKDANITLDKRANINWINHFALSQGFHKVGGRWFKNKDDKDIALSISREAKKFIKVRFRQTDLISNEEFDKELPASLFAGDPVDYQDGYKNREENYWVSNRVEKLSDFEDGFYKRADTFRKSKQYKTLKYMIRVGTTGFFPIPPANWELGRFYKVLSWNEYEGARLRLGGRIAFDSFPKFNVGGHIAYGTKDELFKYGVEAFFNLPRRNNNFHQLSIGAMHDFQRLGAAESFMDFDNTLLSLFRAPDKRLKDIILKDNYRASWAKEWVRGEETTLGIDYTSYHANSYYTFNEILPDGSTTPRNTITSARIIANYRFAVREPVFQNKFVRRRMKSIRPIFNFQSTIGLKGFLGSDYSFLKVKANMTHTLPSFLGQLKYNATVGKIMGKVPYIDIEQLGGNNGLLMDENRYFLMNEGEYSTDMYAQLWLQQKFQGFFLNKIPLLKKLGLRENVFFKGILGSITPENQNYFKLPGQMSAPEGLYAETGVGVANILKFFELDFVWRLTQHDKPTTRPFGVVLGATFEI